MVFHFLFSFCLVRLWGRLGYINLATFLGHRLSPVGPSKTNFSQLLHDACHVISNANIPIIIACYVSNLTLHLYVHYCEATFIVFGNWPSLEIIESDEVNDLVGFWIWDARWYVDHKERIPVVGPHFILVAQSGSEYRSDIAQFMTNRCQWQWYQRFQWWWS